MRRGFTVLELILALALTCGACSMLSGCWLDQTFARNIGGTASIVLERGQRLVTATWKEDHVWYLTRAARPDDPPPTVLVLHESSALGMLQGTVLFREQ